MSLLDLASLVLSPTATKEGKVYSAIPDTGEGDMTFTRGSSATRVNSEGLIEKERGNLVTYSNDFSNWVNTSSSETSGQSGYDGSSDAWQLDKSAANGRIGIAVSGSSVGTMSIYAKAGTKNWVKLSNASTGQVYAFFNLSTGQLGSTGTDIIDSNITSIDNSWYRCSMTFNASYGAFNIWVSENDNDTSGTSGNILIQDAMLNQGLVAQSYIETTTSAVYEGITDDVPRVDYSDGGCPALKLEPQRSNLLTQSEYFGAWTNDTNTSLTANAIQSPSGLIDAYKISAGTSTARQAIKFNLTPSGDVVQSVFAKKGEYSVVQITDGRNGSLYANFDLENGVLGSYQDCTPSIQEFSDGWYRCVIVYNSTLSIVNTRISIAESTTQARLVNFAGNGSDGIYIWGAMVEAGSYVSSYIPTYSVSSTCVADSCSKTGISELIGQTEGTMFVDAKVTLNGRLLLIGAAGNFIETLINSSGKVNAFVRTSVTEADILSTSTYSTGDTLKIAFAYKQNDFALYVNGTAQGTDTSGNVPTNMSQLIINDYLSAGYNSSNGYTQAILFPTRLTNDQLEELTK